MTTPAKDFEEAAEAIEQCEKEMEAAMKKLYERLTGTRIHITDAEMVVSEVWNSLGGDSVLALDIKVKIETEFRNRK